MTKLDVEFVKQKFIEKDLIPLFEEYNKNSEKLPYICNKHKEVGIQYKSYQSLSISNGCKYCGHENTAKNQRLDINKIKEQFINRNYIPKFKNYINTKQLLEYICNKHQEKGIQKISYDHFKNGSGCTYCANEQRSKKQRLDFEKIKLKFKEKNLKLMSSCEDYKNEKSKLEYICNKHKSNGIQSISYTSLSKSKFGCKFCATEINAEKQREDISSIRKVFDKLNLIPIIEKYTNLSTRIKFICKKHPDFGIQESSYISIKNGKFICKVCTIEAKTGKNSSNYNHNITDEERIKRRHSPKLIKWRKDVFKRANYICECCGYDKGSTLNAHHILNYSEYENLRYDIENGICLCKKCHKYFHDKYGYKKNNKEQLDEFMKNYKILGVT